MYARAWASCPSRASASSLSTSAGVRLGSCDQRRCKCWGGWGGRAAHDATVQLARARRVWGRGMRAWRCCPHTCVARATRRRTSDWSEAMITASPVYMGSWPRNPGLYRATSLLAPVGPVGHGAVGRHRSWRTHVAARQCAADARAAPLSSGGCGEEGTAALQLWLWAGHHVTQWWLHSTGAVLLAAKRLGLEFPRVASTDCSARLETRSAAPGVQTSAARGPRWLLGCRGARV